MSKNQLSDNILSVIECGNKFKLPIVLPGENIDDSQAISILQNAQQPFIINFFNNNITDYGALFLAKFASLSFSLKEFVDAISVEHKNIVFIGNNLISNEFANNYKYIMDNNYKDTIIEECNDNNGEPSAKRIKLQEIEEVQDLIQQTLTNTSTLVDDSINVNECFSETTFILNNPTDQASQNLSGNQNDDEWFSETTFALNNSTDQASQNLSGNQNDDKWFSETTFALNNSIDQASQNLSGNQNNDKWFFEANFTLNNSTDQASQNLSGNQNNDEWFSESNLN